MSSNKTREKIKKTPYEVKLKNEMVSRVGVVPDLVEFDGETLNWVVGFKNKLPAYELFIEHYRCQGVTVGWSENLKMWYVARHR